MCEDDRFAEFNALPPEAKVSDVIFELQGANDAYLCDYLASAMIHFSDDGRLFRLLGHTKEAVQGWCSQVGGRIALAGVYEDYIREDGFEIEHDMADHKYAHKVFVNVRSEAWVKVRDQWCRDYSAFLKEFGL